MQTAAITTPTPMTNAQYATAPPFRAKCNGPARYVATRKPRSQSATNTSRSVPRRQRSTAAPASANAHATPTITPIDAPIETVAEETVLVDVHEELRPFGERAAGVARLHAPPLHRVGSIEPEVA